MRNFIKTLAYIKFYNIYMILKFFSKRSDIVVLMYHSIDEQSWKYGISEKDFKKQLKYLIKNYNIVELCEVVDFVRKDNNLKDKSVALTFDDGYQNIYTTVFPLIKKYQLPITVFLTTNLGKQEKLGNIERLSWVQVKEMYKSGLVNFEVHGHNHLNLKEFSNNEEMLVKELGECRQMIKYHLGYQSNYLAYASGHKNKEIIEYIKNQKYEAGFTINEGTVKKGSNSFTIPRVQVDRTINFCLFKMRLTGAVDLNRRFIDSLRKLYGK